jgi:hypothetical protein
VIGGFALAIRLYYVTHVVMFQPVNAPGAKGNAVQYYNYARNLVQHGVFSADPIGTMHPIGDSFRDPGYPVFLAAWMEIFPQWDNWYAAVIFSQAVLSAGTVVLWLAIGRRWMPSSWLFMAGLLMAVWPHSISMSSHLLSETLYGFLVALAMLIFVLGMGRPTFRLAVISGICFSLAAFANSASLPFAALLVICLAAMRQVSPKIALALVATVVCLMTPWMIRNSMQRADQPSSGDRAFMNLVQGSWPQYHSAYMASTIAHDPRAALVEKQIDREVAAIEISRREGLSMMWRRMSANPGHFILWYLKKPALLWDWGIRIGVGDVYVYVTYHSPFDTQMMWRAVEAICHTCNVPIALLALMGCVLALWRYKANKEVTAVALLLLFITCVHSLLQAEPRYSIPYRGAEILLAIWALYQISIQVLDLRRIANPHKIHSEPAN